MRLRYAGTCQLCETALARGVVAVYDPVARKVTCVPCAAVDEVPSPSSTAEPEAVPEPAPGPVPVPVEPEESAEPESYVEGTAGASARREHERRHDRREQRIRTAHPKVGGLMLAVTDDPQSTRAWSQGALGEEKLGKRLDGLASPTVRVLHDRRIPGTKANIDHVVVCPSGVLVIDAKRYQGRPTLRIEGGILRPRVERLLVGRRDCTKLVDGVLKQVALVRSALGLDETDTAVMGMLCFVDADWPLFGGSFRTRGIAVVWPRKAAEIIGQPGPWDVARISSDARAVADHFPPS
jgi:hypothetical protein